MNKFFEKIKAWKDANPKLWLGCSYGGTALLAAGIALAIALPIALAKPATTYRVTFVTDGGTELAAQEVKEGELLSVTNPSKEQYLFSDWYKDETLTQRFDPAADKVESDLTLYAEWVQKYNYVLNDAGTAWTVGKSLGKDYYHGYDLIIPERYQGKPVTKVVEKAFGDLLDEDMEYVEYHRLIIPGTIEEIGEQAFDFGCLDYIDIKPGALTTLPSHCFYAGYRKDTTIVIPKNVTTIADNCFNTVGEGSFAAVCYGGTKDEWDEINIDNTDGSNSDLIDAANPLKESFYLYTDKGYEETKAGRYWFYEPDGSAYFYGVYA